MSFADVGDAPQFQGQQVGQENSGAVPTMVAFWNTGASHQKESSSSSGAAQSAKNVNFQVEGQYPSGSSGQDAGAEGNLRKLLGQESQRDNVMIDVSLSGAHPMYGRPRVVEGPYAPVKVKKGQRGLDENVPEDLDSIRRAEYENLKVKLEAAYRRKVAEVSRKGQEVSENANLRMNQAYELLQRRSRPSGNCQRKRRHEAVHPRFGKSSNVETRSC